MRAVSSVILGLCLWSLTNLAEADVQADFGKHLTQGKLAEASRLFRDQIRTDPDDSQARLALGVTQSFLAVERLSQSFYKYGVSDRGRSVPFLRTVIKPNPNPQPIGYHDFRRILKQFGDDLDEAQRTLAKVPAGEVKLLLPLGNTRLDLNGDGKAEDSETFTALNKQLRLANLANVDVRLDYADCLWLRAYCHLLMAMSDGVVGYDMEEMFNRVGYIFFTEIDSPHAHLTKANPIFNVGRVDVADIIAMVHLINFPVAQESRIQSAHGHLQETLKLSREMWKEIQKETDDDLEWIPNPRQKSAASPVRISPEMVDTWYEFLDECEAVLEGRKKVVHWRLGRDRGVNLRRVFQEPQAFDLVMWIHGSAATPYLEEGPVTEPVFWNRVNRVFGRSFISFAFWFN